MAEQELTELYAELKMVDSMSESDVCQRFNTDTKAEYIEILKDEIQFYENHYND